MKKILDYSFKLLIPGLFLFPLFRENISSMMIIALSLITVFYWIYTKPKFKFQKEFLYLTIPFWIIAINTLFHYETHDDLLHIRHALFFLVIPLCFGLIPEQYFSTFKSVCIPVLKIACTVVILTYFVSFYLDKKTSDLFYESYNQSEFRRYVYSEIKIFVIHPAYFTTFLSLCLTHSLANLTDQKKYAEIPFILLVFVATMLLLTKLNIVFMLGIFLYFLVFRMNMKKIYKTSIVALFLATSALSFVYVPGLKSRFVEIYNSINNPPKGLAYDSTNVRQSIFNCNVELAKENYLFGVGFPKLQNALNQCYEANYDSSFFETQDFLTHNYFFYIFISSGLLGFLLFLFYAYRVGKFAFIFQDEMFTIFLLNILPMCFVEDFLYRHYGVFYFNLILLCFLRFFKSTRKQSA